MEEPCQTNNEKNIEWPSNSKSNFFAQKKLKHKFYYLNDFDTKFILYLYIQGKYEFNLKIFIC